MEEFPFDITYGVIRYRIKRLRDRKAVAVIHADNMAARAEQVTPRLLRRPSLSLGRLFLQKLTNRQTLSPSLFGEGRGEASKFKVMATKKTLASTAKKRATIIAMAAIAGASVSQTSAAARQALADMRDELGTGNHVYSLNYTWDPFDGILA